MVWALSSEWRFDNEACTKIPLESFTPETYVDDDDNQSENSVPSVDLLIFTACQ